MRILLLGLILSANLFAADVIVYEQYLVENSTYARQLVDQEKHRLTIDHVTQENFELYGPEGTGEWLRKQGIRARRVITRIEKSERGPDYPSSSVVVDKLREINRRFPEITKLFSIGNSVQGKPILVMKISDNPNVDEVEPEFKYISNMHGDEIVGRELSVRLIEDLCNGYYAKGYDQARQLIDNTEIFILPSMNPDGADRRIRGNANWVDLNRSFPDFSNSDSNSWNGRPIEVQNIMKWQAVRQFSLSANTHGGAVVTNYPWDTVATDIRYLNLIKKLSLAYASHNPSMANSNRFRDGIINGYDWYEVNGSMQDWSYYWHNDLQITLEVSQRKWPRYDQMPTFYQENRYSLWNFMTKVHHGAGFKITNRPNISGIVTIQKFVHSKNYRGFADIDRTRFHGSEFYKILPLGEYLFKIETNSGESQEVRVVVRDEFPNILENGNYVEVIL